MSSELPPPRRVEPRPGRSRLSRLLRRPALDVAGHVKLHDPVAWLARIRESRSFPILRMARSLELGAGVARDELGDGGEPMAAKLDGAATMIRERGTFLEDDEAQRPA